MRRSICIAIFAGLTVCSVIERTSAIEPLFAPGSCLDQAGKEEDKPTVCYGPCDGTPPKTLLQWSRCANFEGGPPGPDKPLVSDRPDFTEASTTVGRGVAQLEMGYTYTSNSSGGIQTRSHSYPEALLRVGLLADWFEFRINYNYLNQLTTPNGGATTRQNGSEDLYLGMKLGLTPQSDFLPEMALVLQMTVPTGSSAFTAGETLPGINWLYSWEVREFLSLGGSTQFNRAIDDGTSEPYLEFAQSLTIGYTLTERLGAYTEWYVLVPDGADTVRTEHYFDGGFTFKWSNDLQFDIRAGVGLNEAADDYFVGAGLVKRF